MINYAALKTELTNDPQTLGYAGKTDSEIADILNLVRSTVPFKVDRTTIPAYEVIEATVAAEWASLSAAEKQRYQTITGAGEINVKGPNTRAAFLAMFAPATATRAALAALQQRDGSRAEVLFGAGTVVHHLDVAKARAL